MTGPWGGGSLVSHLVSPLLDGLHVGGHDGWLGDLPDGGSHEGSGLGQAQAVGDGGGDRGRGHGGSGGHRVVGGQGSQAVSSVGVGQGTVEQDLGLGVGRGEGKNNLRGDNSQPGLGLEWNDGTLTDFSMVWLGGLVRRN